MPKKSMIMKLEEIADKFDANGNYILDGVNCAICTGELEIIDILSSDELLLYCNSCKLFHVLNVNEKTLNVYDVKNKRNKLKKVQQYNTYIEVFSFLSCFGGISLLIYAICNLLSGRWLQAIIFFSLCIIIYRCLSSINEKYLNSAGRNIIEKCLESDSKEKVSIDCKFTRDINFFKKRS